MSSPVTATSRDASRADPPRDVPWWATIGVSVTLVTLVLVAPLLGAERWQRIVMGELGVIELGTMAVLTVALACGVTILVRLRSLPRPVPILVLIACVGTLYFLGEEISWGQHLLGFATPEPIRAMNEQNEFNLHNMAWGEWFDNIPRQALYVGTIVFGLILPFVRRERRTRPEARARMWYWIIPTTRLVPIALMVAVSSVPSTLAGDRLGDGSYFAMALIDPGGEFKELGLAVFILFGFVSVLCRGIDLYDASAPASPANSR